jgi:hypothetical protein
MEFAKIAITEGSGEYGVLVFTVTVNGSGVPTLEIDELINPQLPAGSEFSCNENLTSLDTFVMLNYLLVKKKNQKQ